MFAWQHLQGGKPSVAISSIFVQTNVFDCLPFYVLLLSFLAYLIRQLSCPPRVFLPKSLGSRKRSPPLCRRLFTLQVCTSSTESF